MPFTPGVESEPSKERRTPGTTMDDILARLDWLTALGCTNAVMESTASFWKSIYDLLEAQAHGVGDRRPVLGNTFY
jgi:hypothetical protein